MVSLLVGVARPNFLSLSLVCVLLAMAVSWYETHSWNLGLAWVVLLIALAAHISVNAFNEYFDFRSGLDYLTQRTPFSGGSGTLIEQPQRAHYALLLALAALMLVVVLGLWLTWQQGWQLLLVGIPGVAMIYAYTQYINRSPLFCLLAPGVGFGLLMTLGAIWVLSGQLSEAAWALAGIVGLLVSNLLLLNQFPDVEADRQVGRRHYPLVLGRQASAWIFIGLLVASYVLLLLAVWQAWLPGTALLSLVTLLPALVLIWGVWKQANQISALVPFMGLNVALCHLYPITLVIGLIWAAA